jgi:2-phospho-L-lactate guanylyltransferase
MIILVPCKHLNAGKSRLSACLNDRDRRDLCERLLDSTLKLAATLVGPNQIRVVTADPKAHGIAARHLVSTIADTTDELNSALQHARFQLAQEGLRKSPLMVLPIDLPFATRESLSEAMDQPADIIIAADEEGTGTNLLLLRSDAWDFPFRFGPNSYSRHVSQAQAAGLRVATLTDWRLARDIDNPDQYAAWTTSAEAGP